MSMAADQLGRSTDAASRRSWAMNQALFTLRRLAYGATLAIGAMGAGVVTLGFQFNSLMEVSTVAFTTLLGSASLARDEIDFLFELAAKTPFEFAGVAQAARQFLGWGFSIEEVNSHLTTMSDVIASMAGDTSVMERVIRAFGQMRSAGVVRMQDLMQLQQAIPGVMGMLQAQLSLSPEVMANIGKARISANAAIAAIMQGISTDPRFKGAAAALQKTVYGQVTTMRDFASRLFGAITIAPFNAIRDELPGINDALEKLSETAANEGFTAMVVELDKIVGAGGRLNRIWETLMLNGTNLWRIFKNQIWPAFRAVAEVTGAVLIPFLMVFGHILGFAADHGTALRIVLTAIIARMVILRAITIATWFYHLTTAIILATKALRALTAAEIIARIAGVRLTGAMKAYIGVKKLQVLWTYRHMTAQQLEIIMSNRQLKMTRLNTIALRILNRTTMIAAGVAGVYALAGGGLAGVLAVLRFAVLGVTVALAKLTMATIVFLLTNPIGWVILLIAGLAFLELKFGLVSKAVRGFWGLLVRFKNWVTGNKISWNDFLPSASPPRWIYALPNVGPAVAGVNIFRKITGLAEGGLVTGGGWSITGERGPELQYTPRGSAIVPLEKAGLIDFQGELVATVPAQFFVDKRLMAEAYAEVKLQKRARK